MVTLVGTQEDFLDALNDLLEFEYEAIEIYEAAINRVENASYISRLQEFKADHQNHIKGLTDYLRRCGIEPVSKPGIKQWFSISRMTIAQIIGDKSVLNALYSAEEDTNTAYERLTNHKDKKQDASEMLNQFFDDEKKHKAWLESILDK